MRRVNAKAYKKGWKQFEDWSNFPGKMFKEAIWVTASLNVVFRILCTLPYILEDLAEFEEPLFCSHQDVQWQHFQPNIRMQRVSLQENTSNPCQAARHHHAIFHQDLVAKLKAKFSAFCRLWGPGRSVGATRGYPRAWPDIPRLMIRQPVLHHCIDHTTDRARDITRRQLSRSRAVGAE